MSKLARNTDPETSHEAAAALNPERLRRIVYGIFEEYHSLTDDELRAHLDARGVRYEKSSATKRRGELVELALLTKTDERRASSSGRSMTVWALDS